MVSWGIATAESKGDGIVVIHFCTFPLLAANNFVGLLYSAFAPISQ